MGIHAWPSLYVHLMASATGGAADEAVECTKYSTLLATHDFVQAAIESLGSIKRTDKEFLQDLGLHMAGRSDERPLRDDMSIPTVVNSAFTPLLSAALCLQEPLMHLYSFLGPEGLFLPGVAIKELMLFVC